MSGRHLDPVRLAELAEGLLPADESAAATAHLDRCAECQSIAVALASVTGQLRSAPAALPTPPDVVARLDRALAAESAESQLDLEAEVIQLSWFRRRAPQLLGAAAAVSALGFAGYALSTVGGDATDTGAAETVTDTLSGDDGLPAMIEEERPDSDEESAEDSDDEVAEDSGEADLDAEDSAEQMDDGEGTVSSLARQASIEAEVLAIVAGDRPDSGRTLASGCGLTLADELGLDLIGAAPTDILEPGSLLVVVDLDTGTEPIVEGWLVPECESTTENALDHPVLVRVE